MKSNVMDHNNGNVWGFLGGIIAGIIGYLISIDWSLLGFELFKAALLGTVGGIAGLAGKKFAERYLFKRKKK